MGTILTLVELNFSKYYTHDATLSKKLCMALHSIVMDAKCASSFNSTDFADLMEDSLFCMLTGGR